MISTGNIYRQDSKPSENRQKSQKCNFRIHPIHQYKGASPYFRKPAEVGHFSLDRNRLYHDDSSQLRHYVPPVGKFQFNLREGYDTYIGKDDDTKERLNSICTWISNHRDVFMLKDQQMRGNDTNLNTDFIAWRGHFTKFLITPYETREPWKMACTLFNGTIYISEVETEKSKLERLNRKPLHQEMCYWGYKFEDFMTQSITDPSKGKSSSPVNSNEAYISVVRTRLDNYSILMSAEVDCCMKYHLGKPPDNYIELKTAKHQTSYKQKQNFIRFKLMRFWAQSFLSGLPKIVLGLRDDDGIVTSLQEFQTLNIPKYSDEEHQVKWDANICMNFLAYFLNWLKKFVLIDNPDVVYMVSFDEPFEIITMEIIDNGSERFLPGWYTIL